MSVPHPSVLSSRARPLLAGALFCALASSAAAEGLSLPAEPGLTGGVGLVAGERAGLRLGFSRLDAERSADSLAPAPGRRLAGIGLLADWQLTDGLRLTGGALYHPGASGLRLLAGSAGSLGLGSGLAAGTPGQQPALADPVRWRLAPYVGLGWASRPVGGAGLGFHADLGLALQPADFDGAFADPAARRLDDEARLRDDSRPLRGWPVLSFGVNWGF
ncbi:hypothetical protein [Derxia lacustris]|uniref:hypothetical protein n=1 Tax=Derxia lacustris TaxID=764842 RepID=UPI00111C307E|nr:hypothetical protein [Derxia lacustris]